MRKYSINIANVAVNHRHAIPLFHRKLEQHSPSEGDNTMSKQQEHEIYCRLAKEIIESRLAVEPTQLRIHRLAKIIQNIDSEVAVC